MSDSWEIRQLPLIRTRIAYLWQSRVIRDFAGTAGTNVSIAVLSSVAGILAARLLGPEGRGELAAAIVWAGMIGVFASTGLPQALTYFAAQEPGAIGRIFYTTLAIWACQSAISLALGWLAVNGFFGRVQP